MCEWCNRLEEATKSGNEKRIERAELDWYEAKFGPEGRIIKEVAQAHAEEFYKKHPNEFDNVGKMMARACAMVFAGMDTDEGKLETLLSLLEGKGSKIIYQAEALMRFTADVFAYGIQTGRRSMFMQNIKVAEERDERAEKVDSEKEVQR